jgi:hypothetical protein
MREGDSGKREQRGTLRNIFSVAGESTGAVEPSWGMLLCVADCCLEFRIYASLEA